MKRSRLDTRDLEAFAAVLRYRHFGAAADSLGVTQSAISQRIAKLEADLGLDLLRRNNQGVEATEDGAAILPEVRAYLAARTRVLDTAAAVRRDGARPLHLLLSNAVVQSAIPSQLRALQGPERQAGFSVEVEAADRIEAKLESREADLAITTLPPADPGLREHQLLRLPVGIAVPAALPGKRKPLAIAALAGVPLVVVPRARDPEVFDRLIVLADRAGVTLTIGREVVAYPSVMAMVALGAGWGVVPLAMAGAAPKGVGVCALDVADPPAITVRIVRPPGRDEPGMETLIARLTAFDWPVD